MSADATGTSPNFTKRLSSRRKVKATRFAENEEKLGKVFQEKDIDYSLGLEPVVHSMNKIFMYPDMVHRLNSPDAEKRNRSLTKLIEWLGQKDALKSGTFQTKELVDSSTRLFQRLKRYGMKHDFEEEEKVLHLIEILSAHERTAKLIAAKNLFIQELYRILYNVQSEHQEPASKILFNLTNKHPEFIRYFVKMNKPFKELGHIFNRPVGTLYYPKNLWLHLSHLLQIYPNLGIKYDFFDVFYNRVQNKMPGFHLENILCLTALLNSKKGLELFERSEMMNILHEIIEDGSPQNMNFEYVLKCMNVALQNEELQKSCAPYPDLPLKITDIALKSKNPNVQYACLEILGKLYFIQPFNKLIHDKCLRNLRRMKCANEIVKCGSNTTPYNEGDKELRILEIASASPKSSKAMASNIPFVKELYDIIENDSGKKQDQAAYILSNLTDGGKGAVVKFYKQHESFEKMKKIFGGSEKRKRFSKHLWVHLAHLLKASPQLGLQHGFYEICVNHIKNEAHDFENGPTLCLASLFGANKCFPLFEKSGVLPILLKFITDTKNQQKNPQNIIVCFHQALQSKELQKEFLEYPDLPATLIEIAHKIKTPELQLNIIEIIRKLYLMPPFDVSIHKCFTDIKRLKLQDELAQYEKIEFQNFLQSRHKLYKLK